MSTTAAASFEEYPVTSFSPDRDDVDGQLIERNPGTKDHHKPRREIFAWFRDRRRGRVVPPIFDLFQPGEI